MLCFCQNASMRLSNILLNSLEIFPFKHSCYVYKRLQTQLFPDLTPERKTDIHTHSHTQAHTNTHKQPNSVRHPCHRNLLEVLLLQRQGHLTHRLGVDLSSQKWQGHEGWGLLHRRRSTVQMFVCFISLQANMRFLFRITNVLGGRKWLSSNSSASRELTACIIWWVP